MSLLSGVMKIKNKNQKPSRGRRLTDLWGDLKLRNKSQGFQRAPTGSFSRQSCAASGLQIQEPALLTNHRLLPAPSPSLAQSRAGLEATPSLPRGGRPRGPPGRAHAHCSAAGPPL